MPLFRGTSQLTIDGIHDNWYLETPRRPLSSSPILHEIADAWFFNKFGRKARTTAIFCTQDFNEAQSFVQNDGHIVEVLLVEGEDYSLIYSKEVNDFTEVYEVSDIENPTLVEEWLNDRNYVEKKCISEIPEDFHGEIMLCCEKFETKRL